MRHYLFIQIAILGCSVSCSSPGGPPIPEVATEINSTLAPVDYVLAPGDLVAVSFPNNTDWDHSRVVQPDGIVSFLAIGTLPVAGLTTAQLEERLSAAYIDVAGAVTVTVSLENLGLRSVTVLGQVLSPGVYPIGGERGERTTLLEALAFAGGPFRGRAYLGSVVFVRWDAEQQRQRAWTIDAREKYWGSEKAIIVQNYDLIFVPSSTIDKVNVWVDKYIRQLLPFPQFIIPAQ